MNTLKVREKQVYEKILINLFGKENVVVK